MDIEKTETTVQLIDHKNGSESVHITNKSGTSENQSVKTRLYKRRFFILGIFCLYSTSSAFQWIEFAIITNICLEYFDTTAFVIQWTSMIYMLSYIPLMFVATWMLDNYGLRKILLFGSVLNALGSLIKLGCIYDRSFVVAFIGNSHTRVFIISKKDLTRSLFYQA